eukprot:14085895-Heterocapsa_arctica.AAC.1
MIGGLNPDVAVRIVAGNHVTGNPAASVPVSRSSESSEASNTVKSLFKTHEGAVEGIPWVAEPITNPPVLPTSSQSQEPTDEGPP